MTAGPERAFYDRQYSKPLYSSPTDADHHGLGEIVRHFVSKFGLSDKKIVEIGCGRGAFQDIVRDYTGTDLSAEVGKSLHKPFVACDASQLPFADATFDAAWSIWVLEHTPNPEEVLSEIRRVVRPGGYILLRPAWHCRWFVCYGVPVRPYQELPWRFRVVKAAIPLLESRLTRGLTVIPRRTWQTFAAVFRRPMRLWFKPLRGDFETFWCPDSDAVAYLDPVATALWFESRGDRVISHPKRWRRLFLGAPALVIQRGD